MNVTELRLGLLDRCFIPIPITSPDAPGKDAGKRPNLPQWQTLEITPKVIMSWGSARRQETNTGLRCGYLLGLDIDVLDAGLVHQLCDLASDTIGPTPLMRIGRAPKVLLAYRTTTPFTKIKTRRLLMPDGQPALIECLASGQQFVGFGTHPGTRQPYRWLHASPVDVPLSELPVMTETQARAFVAEAERLLRAAGGQPEAKDEPADVTLRSRVLRPPSAWPPPTRQDVVDALKAVSNTVDWHWWMKIGAALFDALADDGEDLFIEWSAQSPNDDPEYTRRKWRSFRTSTTTTTAATLFWLARQRGWKPPSENNERPRRMETHDADPHGTHEWGAASASPPAGDDRANTESPDDPPPADDAASGADAPWQKYLQTDDRGQVMANLANAALAIRQAPELVGLVAYDEMLRHALVTRSLPGSRMAAVSKPRPLQDTDVAAIQEWLQRHKLRRLGREVTQQACDLVAREHAFHPVRDYLTGLTWDGTPRLNTWMSRYLGATATSYTAVIGRCFPISMVARIMRPGCKCDYMPVLEGPQGALKSTACAILAGEWYSDNLPELHRGDQVRISMHLRGKWLIEIAEMSAISKAEADALKAFLTQTEERYTPKYARNEVIEPRQCTFVGTTNKAVYLRDETGGRRTWPIKTTVARAIDTAALARDRDQLFAEAMAALTGGEKWWPDSTFEAEHIKPEQEARFVADAWEAVIGTWLETPVVDERRPSGVAARMSCTVAEVAGAALGLETARLGTTDQRRITAALERLGWARGQRTNHGRPWVRQ